MARKSGLGKGLDALIPVSAPSQAGEATNHVPVNKIIPNPRQPRHIMSENSLEELANSIREHGILQPLLVTYDLQSDLYVLIAGERRLRAARLAGLETVPVIEVKASEQERLEIALIENVQRADLTPLETADAYRQLSEEFNLSHEEIAARVGKSRVTITNTMRLLKLSEDARLALAEERISEGHARALLGLNNTPQQTEALKIIIKGDLTVRQTEELVKKINGQPPKKIPKMPPLPEIQEVEERLRHHLGTKLAVRHGKEGGSITIYYYSDEELNSLVYKITGIGQ